jgi:iron complex transport system permease protein
MRKICLAILLLLAIGSLFVGAHEMTLTGLMANEPSHWMILMKVRIPRTVSLILAGAVMSLCGKIIQHLMQNKFVAADVIGLTDSARLGILIVMLWLPNASGILRTTAAFLFSYTGVLLFLWLSRLIPKKDPMILPLTGVMFGNVIGAISSFLAYRYQLVQNVSSWLQGNFATVIEGNYELIYLTLPIFALLYFLAYEITIAGLGETTAKNLGINYHVLRLLVFALVAFASSVVLLLVGSVPFLGVIIPNIVALFVGDHIKNNLFLISLSGSGFLLLCDILARVVIAPYELPVSVVAGIIGGISFLVLLMRRKVV